MTSKISCMNEAYANFAGGFTLFNLVMAPPGALKELWQLDEWFPLWFDDDTFASKAFSGHLFWVLSTWTTTVSVHICQLFVLRLLRYPIPGCESLARSLARSFNRRINRRINHVGMLTLLYLLFLPSFPSSAVPVLAWPQMEIVMVLVTSMGMLDVSFGVLATFASAKGWKLLAAVEVLLVLLFVRWFVGQGKRFMQKSRWEA